MAVLLDIGLPLIPKSDLGISTTSRQAAFRAFVNQHGAAVVMRAMVQRIAAIDAAFDVVPAARSDRQPLTSTTLNIRTHEALGILRLAVEVHCEQAPATEALLLHEVALCALGRLL